MVSATEFPKKVAIKCERAVSLRRDDSRIAADLDWRLKALIDHKVDGNSAVFSAEEEGYFYRNPET